MTDVAQPYPETYNDKVVRQFAIMIVGGSSAWRSAFISPPSFLGRNRISICSGSPMPACDRCGPTGWQPLCISRSV